MRIPQLIDFILHTEGITNKKDLGKYAGLMKNGDIRYAKLYKYCEKMANDHWISLKDPKARVRGDVETKIKGYKICKP